MINFEYYTPTKVVFGKDSERRTGELAKEFGAGKVLVHYGGQSARRSGLLDRVCGSLEEAGIPFVTLGGAQPNPRLGLVHEGMELCKKEGNAYGAYRQHCGSAAPYSNKKCVNIEKRSPKL